MDRAVASRNRRIALVAAVVLALLIIHSHLSHHSAPLPPPTVAGPHWEGTPSAYGYPANYHCIDNGVVVAVSECAGGSLPPGVPPACFGVPGSPGYVAAHC